MAALMTKEKNPRVRIVSGSPKRLKIGFTKIFSTPSTRAKIMADENPSNCTPGKILVKR